MKAPKYCIWDIIIFDNNGWEQVKIKEAFVDTDKSEWLYITSEWDFYEEDIIWTVDEIQWQEADDEWDKSFDAWLEQSELMKGINEWYNIDVNSFKWIKISTWDWKDVPVVLTKWKGKWDCLDEELERLKNELKNEREEHACAGRIMNKEMSRLRKELENNPMTKTNLCTPSQWNMSKNDYDNMKKQETWDCLDSEKFGEIEKWPKTPYWDAIDELRFEKMRNEFLYNVLEEVWSMTTDETAKKVIENAKERYILDGIIHNKLNLK